MNVIQEASKAMREATAEIYRLREVNKELLEAAKGLSEIWECGQDLHRHIAIKTLRAAIAKAEGGK